MDSKTFERHVTEAVEGLPQRFRDALENIEIVIEEFPSPEIQEDLGDGPPLLGLYEGTPLPDRQLGEIALPDKISIFRGELLKLGLRRADLVREIRITVHHELGHYFGLDDDEMEDLGY